MYDRALTIQDEVAAADPRDMHARIEAAKLRVSSAVHYKKAGRGADALPSVEEAIKVFEQALSVDPSSQDYRLHEGWAWTVVGDIRMRQAQRSGGTVDHGRDAVTAYDRAEQSLRRLALEGQVHYPVSVPDLLAHIARCRLELGRVSPPVGTKRTMTETAGGPRRMP